MPDSNKPQAQQSEAVTKSVLGNRVDSIVSKVADKIQSADNILVALSKDPSVDEVAAAIGLTIILDRIGKHVTAIYSGATPNALEFLRPDETFEKNTNSLQDFIIALGKEKADHLRYKVEGEYVKVYITPYRTTINQDDLGFSHGDYNVELVIAFDVQSGDDLDGALSEYGRIMHDATAINITTSSPGRFAELEWSEPGVSSVCEMVVNLATQLDFKQITEDIATALLTGIVAATSRFSNQRTTPQTMSIAAELMSAGADQQLISSNIMIRGHEDDPKVKDLIAEEQSNFAHQQSETLTSDEVATTQDTLTSPNSEVKVDESSSVNSQASVGPQPLPSVQFPVNSQLPVDFQSQAVAQSLSSIPNQQSEQFVGDITVPATTPPVPISPIIPPTLPSTPVSAFNLPNPADLTPSSVPPTAPTPPSSINYPGLFNSNITTPTAPVLPPAPQPIIMDQTLAPTTSTLLAPAATTPSAPSISIPVSMPDSVTANSNLIPAPVDYSKLMDEELSKPLPVELEQQPSVAPASVLPLPDATTPPPPPPIDFNAPINLPPVVPVLPPAPQPIVIDQSLTPATTAPSAPSIPSPASMPNPVSTPVPTSVPSAPTASVVPSIPSVLPVSPDSTAPVDPSAFRIPGM
ncbi:MAG: hypothetical protein Q4A30_00290 [Candidatus Saccharibacteria bacterium]|nr:hypothetical protein [Candidatus Saccharibacteria bacterium]